LKLLSHTIERQAVPVLAHEERGYQLRTVESGWDDLVAGGRTDELGIALLACKLLALVQADDDLGGDKLNNLRGLVADARALLSAPRTWALFVGYHDRIVYAAQLGRRWAADRRLLWPLLLVRTAPVLF
jgi:hypothetical protein